MCAFLTRFSILNAVYTAQRHSHSSGTVLHTNIHTGRTTINGKNSFPGLLDGNDGVTKRLDAANGQWIGYSGGGKQACSKIPAQVRIVAFCQPGEGTGAAIRPSLDPAQAVAWAFPPHGLRAGVHAYPLPRPREEAETRSAPQTDPTAGQSIPQGSTSSASVDRKKKGKQQQQPFLHHLPSQPSEKDKLRPDGLIIDLNAPGEAEDTAPAAKRGKSGEH